VGGRRLGSGFWSSGCSGIEVGGRCECVFEFRVCIIYQYLIVSRYDLSLSLSLNMLVFLVHIFLCLLIYVPWISSFVSFLSSSLSSLQI